MRTFLILVFCSFWLNFTVSAQYRFDSWTTENGLPQNTVRQMVQTSDGYLWLTTLDGLVRFDGVRFKVFNKSNSPNLLGNRFISIFADSDDTLWLGTEEKGLVRYRKGEFYTFSMEGLSSNTVLKVAKRPDGNIYAYTVAGLLKIEGDRFISASTREEMIGTETHFASSGSFWQIGKSFLSVTRNGQKSDFELPAEIRKDLETELNLEYTVGLYEDRHGILWITTNTSRSLFTNGKIYKFTGGRFEKITAEMPSSAVNQITEDAEGNIWLATNKDGACRIKGNEFICLNSENGLETNIVNSIFTDREGTFWITTEDKGIVRLTEQFIASFSTKQGLKNKNVYPILEDKKGGIWIGSLGGLAYYKDGKITNYSKNDDFTFIEVQSLFEDVTGRLWIGTYNGVQYFENGKFYYFDPKLFQNLDNQSVSDIHQDQSGVLWFATNAGLIRYDGRETKLFTTQDGLPGNNIKVILENDDGSLWLGTFNGLVLLKDEKFTVYTEKDGLAGNYVRSLYKDDEKTLWIGTYDSGLSRFKDGKLARFTTETGLSSNGAFQILEDSRNYFWISNNQGIYHVSRNELNQVAEGKRQFVHSTLYGKSDGMLIAETNGGGQPAGIKTSDGKLLFPTQDGIAIVTPEAVKTNTLAPPVVIESVKINNQEILKFQFEIEVQPNQENLEINYTGLSFIKPEQIRFRYILEGLDKDWTDAGERRTAYFPHLPPGNYTFRVIAANSDNVWNEEGASIEIVVYPAFYQTWWFIVLCTVIIAAIVFLIYRKRLLEEKRKHAAQEEFSRRLIAAHESERRRVAAELHDSLGQTLAMIKNRAVFARQNAENVEKAQEQFDQITEQSVEAINEVREISYNLRPYLLDRLGLTKALKSLFTKTSENTNLRINAEIENIDKIFSSEEEMSIYRIIQESLNNIIKHAEAENVEINISRSEKFISIKIADDGRGFLPNQSVNINKKGGFGLLGMAERIKILGGSHTIESVLGKGTGININLDISKQSTAKNNG